MSDGYLGVYALLDRLHVVTDTLSQSLPDTELRGEFWKLKTTKWIVKKKKKGGTNEAQTQQ